MKNEKIFTSQIIYPSFKEEDMLGNLRKVRENLKNKHQNEDFINEFCVSSITKIDEQMKTNSESEEFNINNRNINSINLNMQLNSRKSISSRDLIYENYYKSMTSLENGPSFSKGINNNENNPMNSFTTTNNFSGKKMVEFNVNPFKNQIKKENSIKEIIYGYDSIINNVLKVEASFKPRKGDKTPKINISDVEIVSDENPVINDKRIHNTDPYREKNEDEKLDFKLVEKEKFIKQKKKLTTKNKSLEKTSINGISMGFRNNKKNINEILLLKKEIHKSDTKVNQKSKFINRMKIDIVKRQSKEERLKMLIDKNTPKKSEIVITKTFNRLIQDANRRLEANHHLDSNKEILSQEKKSNPKKFKDTEWKSYYNNSVDHFLENRDKKIKDKSKQKEIEIKKKEENILKDKKVKKASNKEIDLIFQRIYGSPTISTVFSKKDKENSKKNLNNKSIYPFSNTNTNTNTNSGITKSKSKNEICKTHLKMISPYKNIIHDKVKFYSNKIGNKVNIFNLTDGRNTSEDTINSGMKRIKFQEKKTNSLTLKNMKYLPLHLTEENIQKDSINETGVSHVYLNNLKDTKSIKLKKIVNKKPPRPINDIQASKMVRNIFQRNHLK